MEYGIADILDKLNSKIQKSKCFVKEIMLLYRFTFENANTKSRDFEYHYICYRLNKIYIFSNINKCYNYLYQRIRIHVCSYLTPIHSLQDKSPLDIFLDKLYKIWPFHISHNLRLYQKLNIMQRVL